LAVAPLAGKARSGCGRGKSCNAKNFHDSMSFGRAASTRARAGARARSRIVAQCAADGVDAGEAGDEMHSNPKFWALTAAFFILLYLAAINIVVKINMLLHLAENG
jgi:hypothetical protein